MAFGIIIFFVMLIAFSGILMLNILHNKAERSGALSTEIQYLVQEMNTNLYKSRSLEKDFFLWYPIVGYSTAQQKYAQAANVHAASVETLSIKLQNLLSRSDVGDAWREKKSSLNLYISSAKRHSLSIKETEALIALWATSETGLEETLARRSSELEKALKVAGVNEHVFLFHQMRHFEKEYIISRQRPLIQSAFNIAIPLKEAITLAPALEAEEKRKLLAALNHYLTTMEEVADLSSTIRRKFNEFDLAHEAISPITEELFALATQEIERARTQMASRNQLSIVVLLVTALAGLLLSSVTALILNKSITVNVVKLTEAAGKFQTGNLEARVHIDSGDEFAEIGKSFNAMADSISTQVDTLGKTVSLRTHALTVANKQLSQEITERIQMEAQLLLERDKLKAIFETMTDGIYIVDKQYDISYVNPVLEKEFGSYKGRKCYTYFHDRNEPCPWCKIDEVFAGKTLRSERTSEKDGRIYDLIDTPIINADNTVSKLQIFRDITEQNKMKEQLLLSEKLTTIAGLAAGVAHEINTPLSGILQAHQLIVMALSPEETSSKEKAAECAVDLLALQDYFKKNELNFFMNGIRESAIKAGDIIRKLLDFSRPHEGHFSTVNLEDIMESSLVLSLADYSMKKEYGIAKVQIIKEYAPDPCSLICVATEIEQVVLNLIKNSVLSMAEGDQTEKPRITLRTFTTADMAVIEVEDNGPGIAKDIQNNIFDPFFTTRDVGTGTGLGLSVSHAIIVDKHSGNIRVESEPGQGAKFIIEIPLAPEDTVINSV